MTVATAASPRPGTGDDAGSATARRRRTDKSGGWREAAAYQLFLVPVAAVFIVLFVIPLGQTFYWSLTDFTGYSTDVTFIGLKNYRTILSDPSMLAGLSFTLLFAVGTTLLTTVIAIPLAVALNQRLIGRNFARSLFFFPAIPSMAVLGLVWGYILSPLGSGVLNSVLDSTLGLGPVPWLSDPTLAKLSVIMVGVWGGAGWHAVLYLAYLQSIPAEYYEVATIDGANARQQFFHITLPLLMPAMVISQFLLMTGGLKVFDLPYALTNGGPGFATQTITQSIIVNGVGQGQYGIASALAVLFTLAVAVLSFSQLLISRRIERKVL
ncbi:sugar ABC transporter permease [Streptomyces sp. 8K308]|uniref:carbohydrate ABC transporter permease n=1 Tax=Streptomyces sp. 8K308 TaxID=2530388 RepID=UPI001047DA70|nr:sugar ABC transporter permease [Streptomyces sp. 8K308]TDC23623.1 sugar ABC transporter permease [Streptomyces sp. 8K308]